MSFIKRICLLISAAVAVVACGPFFGLEVLGNRQQFLLAPPTVSFGHELITLVPGPQDHLPVVDAEVTHASVETPEDAAPAFQFYKAGATSFLNGQLEPARQQFLRVLALPEDQRKVRDVWAQYMLGRIAALRRERVEAATRFEAVRTLVRNGDPDPLGLAVGSYGEQGRMAWEAGDLPQAVELYARQTSYESRSGASSLLILAGRILKDPKLLDSAVRDPIARRLVFLAVNKNSYGGYSVGSESERLSDSTIDRIADALERNGIAQAPGTAFLASGAYQHGRFDLAERLCALDHSPLTAWTAAKLALRKGDREAALNLYDQALTTVAPSGSPTLHAEIGILRVARGEYVQALDTLYRAAKGDPDQGGEMAGFAAYWGDVAYLAERVLTIQELQSFVDRKPGKQQGSQPKIVSEQSRLRSLLARRLMRAERRSEALRYFDDPKVRTVAEQYDRALSTAAGWWHWKRTRAEAWFGAALLARNSGMEILGFERDPDYAMWGGEFGGGDRSDVKTKADPFDGPDEKTRVGASLPKFDTRFQYRATAAEEAKRSADFLPERSQAFGAVLCDATLWVINNDPAEANKTYRRYVRQGAYMPWTKTFGRSCPAPDFPAASRSGMVSRQWRRSVVHAKAHPWLACLAALTASALWMLYRSRGRTSGGALSP